MARGTSAATDAVIRSSNLEHYLDVLEKKPGAMAGSTPLEQWRQAGRWPECLDRIWRTAGAASWQEQRERER